MRDCLRSSGSGSRPLGADGAGSRLSPLTFSPAPAFRAVRPRRTSFRMARPPCARWCAWTKFGAGSPR